MNKNVSGRSSLWLPYSTNLDLRATEIEQGIRSVTFGLLGLATDLFPPLRAEDGGFFSGENRDRGFGSTGQTLLPLWHRSWSRL